MLGLTCAGGPSSGSRPVSHHTETGTLMRRLKYSIARIVMRAQGRSTGPDYIWF